MRIVADEVEVAATLFGMEHAPHHLAHGLQDRYRAGDHVACVEHVDAPGRIGVIGTILGEAAANITRCRSAPSRRSPARSCT
ncbi:MAG: hypothetical protein ACLUYK_01415 [Eggerthella lenta]